MMDADVIRLDLPASLKYLNVVSAAIAEVLKRVGSLQDADGIAASAQLAVQEVCTNIVGHAYQDTGLPERIYITLSILSMPRRLLVSLHDTGRAFDLTQVRAPDLDDVHEHGYGLYLMRQLMDDVRYERQSDGNHWYLSKKLPYPGDGTAV